MRSKAIEYPRPVLNEYSNDFVNSVFSVNLVSQRSENDSIKIVVEPVLNCTGIAKMLKNGLARIIARVVCDRTFYREIHTLCNNGQTEIVIPKDKVTDKIDVQSMIVAECECKYNLTEFNPLYFSGTDFTLRRGDVIAEECGLEIFLQEILRKPLPSLFVVDRDGMSDTLYVDYPTNTEPNSLGTDYVIIYLPDKDYILYSGLQKRVSYNYLTERILQNAIVLPVLVDSINMLRQDEENVYSDTLWAHAIRRALKKHGIDDIDDNENSPVTLANIIFDDVVAASLESLNGHICELDNRTEEPIE